MQVYIGIHDVRSRYKHSCSLPVFDIHVNQIGDVSAIFRKSDYEYIKTCISKLERVNITIISKEDHYIQFSLRDYHFTSQIEL